MDQVNHRRIYLTVESALYLGLFGLALVLRLYHLNAHPLTDAEAREALTVYRFLRGTAQPGAAGPDSPAYFFFTYFNFLVFHASDAIARLAPALFGASLVFVPAFFRDPFGRLAALFSAGLIAMSSGLVAASRSADGAILALWGLAFGLGALYHYLRTSRSRWLVAGAAALGIGLASGPPFLSGLLIAALTVAVISWINPEDREGLRLAWTHLRMGAHGRTLGIALGLTLLIVPTVGLIYLRGLGALTESWLAWFGGFSPSAALRAPLSLPGFLVVYEPLVLVLGIVGAVRAFRTAHPFGQALAWYSLLGLAFTLLYSGRSLFDVIWLALPLAGLAGWTLADWVSGLGRVSRDDWAVIGVQLGVIVALLGFAAINVANFAEQVRINPAVAGGPALWQEWFAAQSPYRFISLVGLAAVLTVVVSYLFSLGWSGRAARLGFALGWAAALWAAGMSAGWNLTQVNANNPVELWWDAPESATTDDLHLLMETLESVSNFSVGNEHDVEVVVFPESARDGALGWALRDFPHVSYVRALDPGFTSPVVISPEEQDNPTLGSSYVGQDFALRRTASYDLSWPEWIGWLAFRRAPVDSERIILWVRQDVQQLQEAGR